MKCNHPQCATQANCLLRFCPGCRTELYRFSAREGQIVAEPTPMAGDAGAWWFALVKGDSPATAPLRVKAVLQTEGPSQTLHLALDDGANLHLPLARLLLASAEGREWVGAE